MLVSRLQQPADRLWVYISDMASTCVTHVLSLMKTLYPKQDMKPYVIGRVEGVSDREYAALEFIRGRP